MSKSITRFYADLGMNDYCIEIRGMSNVAQAQIGRVNAFVVPSVIFNKKSHAYLYISEDWFDTLSLHEKQALVRHELMHLKHNHEVRKNRFSLISCLGMCFANYFLRSAIKSNYYKIVVNYASLFGFLFLNARYSRACEKEADIKAALTMQDKQAFVNLFNIMKQEIDDAPSRFKFKRAVQKLFYPIAKFFSTHPEFEERIAYINELQ